MRILGVIPFIKLQNLGITCIACSFLPLHEMPLPRANLITVLFRLCVCVCVCVCARARACVRTCVCVLDGCLWFQTYIDGTVYIEKDIIYATVGSITSAFIQGDVSVSYMNLWCP